MLESTTDVTHPDGYIRYARSVALSRLALVACFVVLLAAYAPSRLAWLGLLEFGLYLALLIVTELATRQTDRVAASRRLRWQYDGLMVLLVANASWMAIQIRLLGDPIMRVEAALLAICVLLFVALRVHMSRVSYFIGILPPAVTLIWIAVDRTQPLLGNHYAFAMLLFVAAVLLVTGRQQATDRALASALQGLTRKNLALSQATEDAKAASRAKTRLLAVASHEIRTPLNAVLGFGQALRREPLTPAQADLARGVVEGGEQLTRLLDGILDLAHADAGQAQLNLAPFDLRRMIGTTVGIWRGHALAMGVELAFDDADPNLAFGIVADGPRLEQTLVTLLSSALKATPSGGQVRVRLAGVAQGDTLGVIVEVQDTGPPVPPEDRPLAFASFDQTARGRLLGDSGLGLAACAANLALMKGEVGVADLTDAPGGQGAVFWFAFHAPIHAPPASAAEGAMPVGGTVRVLAAEDNAANRRVLAALLNAAPVDLVFAEDGAQALRAWRSSAFDLILMDANMPVMSGVEALRDIRAAEAGDARVPVWMLTANVSDEDVARYREAGADGVLRKPLDAAALFAVLAEAAAG